ncbi:hypothetical protein EDD37DRAFT_644269 [Exophiala viscosa]|uniref:Uncharacterized protein n=1 Tax=Exophiala viscosa TaxID=2486360 RepID=A0AAN6DK66_9EURO|nr:hypothetical protein EDD36DRAFT_112013 [Exophiala viscosa]KAI1628473.1 hypothetical protein EDD37DRAFT_644269 [Exophiala viscosa]
MDAMEEQSQGRLLELRTEARPMQNAINKLRSEISTLDDVQKELRKAATDLSKIRHEIADATATNFLLLRPLQLDIWKDDFDVLGYKITSNQHTFKQIEQGYAEELVERVEVMEGFLHLLGEFKVLHGRKDRFQLRKTKSCLKVTEVILKGTSKGWGRVSDKKKGMMEESRTISGRASIEYMGTATMLISAHHAVVAMLTTNEERLGEGR